VLPRLFEGKLPDLNIGTQDGRTAAPGALQAVTDAAARSAYTWIANGRFKGGYNTRHYGAPETGVHAIQLEMCQSTYMDETEPFDYAPEAAGQVQVVVKDMVGAALDVIRGL
jgi:N-formylglutamate deformylase